MAHFEDALVELLVKHNCVIVPNFGGFVARISSAHVNNEKGIIEPPKKSLLFNRSLVNNDGLLVNHLAQMAQVTFDDSSNLVQQQVQKWQTTLDEGSRIELDKIGMLYLDDEKNIRFEQDRNTNLLLQSYGLEAVHFVGQDELKMLNKTIELHPETIEPLAFSADEIEIEKTDEPAKVIELQSNKTKLPILKYAAAAVLVPFAFYSYWIPMHTPVLKSGLISLQDLNPNYEHKDGNYQKEALELQQLQTPNVTRIDEKLTELAEDVQTYSYKFSDDLFIPVKLKSEKTTEESSEKVTNKGLGQYIVGAFSNIENAQQLVSDLTKQGLNAQILERSGQLIRVSAGSPRTTDELAQIQLKTKALKLEGWLLK